MPPKKECDADKILNPKTNRCVNKEGKLGQELLMKKHNVPGRQLKFMFVGWKGDQACKKVIGEMGGKVVAKLDAGLHSVILPDSAMTGDAYLKDKTVKKAAEMRIPMEVAKIFLATREKLNKGEEAVEVKKKKANKKALKKEVVVEKPMIVKHSQADYYEAFGLYDDDKDYNGYKTFSIKKIEKHLDVHLKHGDVVNFYKERLGRSRIVVENAKGALSFINNPDNTDAGYLSIPLEVTRRISDVKAYYKKVFEAAGGYVSDVELPAHDAIIKRIFEEPSVLLTEGKFMWDIGNNELIVDYKNKSKGFDMSDLSQEEIEARFGIQE